MIEEKFDIENAKYLYNELKNKIQQTSKDMDNIKSDIKKYYMTKLDKLYSEMYELGFTISISNRYDIFVARSISEISIVSRK